MCKDELSAIRMSYTGDEGMASRLPDYRCYYARSGRGQEDIPVSMIGHAEVTVAMRKIPERCAESIGWRRGVPGLHQLQASIEVTEETDPSTRIF